MNKLYRKGVFAVILDETDNALIIQKPSYRPADWTLIGGGREENESAIDNLYREVFEETGAIKEQLEVVGKAQTLHSYDYPMMLKAKIHDGKYDGQSYDIFVVRFKGDKRDLRFAKEEVNLAKWVTIRELQDYLHFPDQLKNISKAISEVMG